MEGFLLVFVLLFFVGFMGLALLAFVVASLYGGYQAHPRDGSKTEKV